MVMEWLFVVCVLIPQDREFVFGESSGSNWRWPAAKESGPAGGATCQSQRGEGGLATQPATRRALGGGCPPGGTSPLK